MPAEADVAAAAARALADHVPAGAPIAVALSGGRDSVVLLHAVLRVAAAGGHRVSALHVHHGLSPHADAWQRHCADLCAAHGVPLAVRAIVLSRAPRVSVEAEARTLRYAALAEAALASGVRHVALAHHRDDQAETLLLQLLRGAGPHGLAGMPGAYADARGVTFVRPLLSVARAAIDEFARAAALAWVDDESNAQHRHRRNAVRHVVMPALAQVFPQPSLTLARAAAHQADAAHLADDLAALDAAGALQSGDDGLTLACAPFAALPPHRARNLLRWFLRRRGLPAPSTVRLAEMLRQLARPRADAGILLAHAGVELGVHRGRLVAHAPAPPAYDVPWRDEPALVLPHGRLEFTRCTGAGIAQTAAARGLRARPRAGGERIRLPGRPDRKLADLLQEAGLPPWTRRALPLLWCGDALAAVPGLGVAAAFAAADGAPGFAVAWQPTVV